MLLFTEVYTRLAKQVASWLFNSQRSLKLQHKCLFWLSTMTQAPTFRSFVEWTPTCQHTTYRTPALASSLLPSSTESHEFKKTNSTVPANLR